MVRNKKVTGTAKSVPVGIFIGTLAALGVTVTGSLITAWLVINEKTSENAIGYFAMLILLAASMAGAYTAQSLVKHQRMVICASVGVAYYISLLAVTALFFGGQYQGMGVTALTVAAGIGAVILIGLKGENGHRRKFKKYGYG